MGTRSTVKFYSEYNQKEPVLSVYEQYDGYIDGVGHKLANFLLSKKMINGISQGQDSLEKGFANGMGCLAAQYVRENKKRTGGFYLTTSEDTQEYNYKVRFIDNDFIIKVDGYEPFEGTPRELLNYQEE